MALQKLKAMIGPSLLACDLSNLQSESERVMKAGADYLHIDVMDGNFVPNLSWGPGVISCLRKSLNNPAIIFDVHLMVTNPEQYIDSMAEAGADQFTFHIEAHDEPKRMIEAIKAKGMKAGITLKPKTSIDTILELAASVDFVLIMTVEPGFGGQKFMTEMMEKVEKVRAAYPNLNIGVDGGLGPDTIDIAAKAGANWIVAGSSIFKSSEPAKVIDILRKSVETKGGSL